MQRVQWDAHKELEEGTTLKLDWNKLDKVASKRCDVVPVVVQDTNSGAVLIAAYVNEVALAETFKQRVCCLWSTSRNELWVKGATSGDTLDLDDVRVNCEQNSLLFLVTPRRKGACHTKDAAGVSRVACYYRHVLSGPDGALTLAHVADGPPRPRRAGVSAEHGGLALGLGGAALLAAAAALAGSLATAVVLRRRG